MEELTVADLEFIKESLQYTRKNFEEYTQYPDYNFKRAQLDRVEKVINKVSEILKTKKAQ